MGRIRIHDGQRCGVYVNANARGRLERCELWGNAGGGVVVKRRLTPHLSACTIRDHSAGRACGVYVRVDAGATVAADCVFARNAGGDVVHEVAVDAHDDDQDDEEKDWANYERDYDSDFGFDQ